VSFLHPFAVHQRDTHQCINVTAMSEARIIERGMREGAVMKVFS